MSKGFKSLKKFESKSKGKEKPRFASKNFAKIAPKSIPAPEDTNANSSVPADLPLTEVMGSMAKGGKAPAKGKGCC